MQGQEYAGHLVLNQKDAEKSGPQAKEVATCNYSVVFSQSYD